MDGAKERMNVPSTPMVMQQLNAKLKFAKRGHNILKKKSEVLQMKFRVVSRDLAEFCEIMGEIFQEASFLIAEAKYFAGAFAMQILHGVQDRARFKVNHTIENIAGVKLIRFECCEVGKDDYKLVGLGKGAGFLQKIKQAYGKAIEVLVELATLKSAFQSLDEVIKLTNQRVNALEYRYMPLLENTLRYVRTEMGEKEREDFYRLKKVQDIKERQWRERQAEMKARREDADQGQSTSE